MRGKSLALLLFAFLAAAGMSWWLARHATTLHSSSVAPASAAVILDSDPPGPVGGTADTAPRSVSLSAPTARRITDPFARYDASTDLFPLAEELRASAEHGDTSAVAALAELEDECSAFVLSRGDRSYVPRAFQQRDPNIKPWVDAMLARTITRCQRFTRSDLMPSKQIHEMLVSAAQQGSPSAKARLLVRTVDLEHLSDDALGGTVRDILASGDPAAIADTSNVMGARVQGREQLFDLPSGTETASQAYLVAACRLGLDCGPDSRILANLCFNGMGCGYSSVEAFVQDTMLPPQQFRVMQQEVQQILARIPHH